jgi:hypothetical protein
MNRLLSYLLLLSAVLAFASAASAFLALGDVPPILKPAWRVQITTIAQFFPASTTGTNTQNPANS